MDYDEHDDPDEGMGLPPSKLGRDDSRSGGSRKSAAGPGGGGGRYRECLKNHAVGIRGHAVDGCGEFLPAGEEGTLDALLCAACSCHRNFHRKECPETGGGGGGQPYSPYYRTPAGYLLHHAHPLMTSAPRAPATLALPSTSPGEGGAHSRGEEEELSDPTMMGLCSGVGGAGIGSTSGSGGGGGGGGKKRFRTKFTQEQKEKMLAFAERVGWRIQKDDEAAVQQLCNETAIKRRVLKVWMHNNKHSLGKKP